MVVFAWLALVALPQLAHAGYVVVDNTGEQTLIARGRLKFVPKEAGEPTLVLDLAAARMWISDPTRRTFWEGTVDEYCTGVRAMIAGGLAGAEQQMKERMAGMSPAEREQVQKMMEAMKGSARSPGAAPAKVTVERGARDEPVAGMSARRYRVFADGKLYEELWLTTDPAFIRELDLTRTPETFGRMRACLVGAAQSAGESVEDSAEYRALFQQGWPLKSVNHGAGGAGGRSAVKIDTRDIPDAQFAPPSGFRRAPLAEVFGDQR